MPIITNPDGADIKGWGMGRPVGWPLNADVWGGSADFVASYGFRSIAHDRQGGGRSSQRWDGNDMDQYADGLAVLIDTLDLAEIGVDGHSTGGGEAALYIGHHGTAVGAPQWSY